MKEKAAFMKVAIKNGITDLGSIRDNYNSFAEGGPLDSLVIKYPEVTIKEEPWADAWFKNNKRTTGMAIGNMMNNIEGPRRVIFNPYSGANKESVLLNERLRHYFDETDFKLPNPHKKQIDFYRGSAYEGDTLNIGRTEAARYLSGDPSHHLSQEQINYLNRVFNIKSEGGPIKTYSEWSRRLADTWGTTPEELEKHDYDYKKYYDNNTEEAWKQLEDVKQGIHFPDDGKGGIYKKTSHPTYPDRGEKSWSPDDRVFYPSSR